MNFLVWESDGSDGEETRYIGEARHTRRILTEFNTAPFKVTAKDSNAACMKVMRQTRRIGKYAVTEVEIIDYTTIMDEEDETTPGQLEMSPDDVQSTTETD